MDEPITFPVTEEAPVKTYDPETGKETSGGEIDNFGKFMDFWSETAKMDPDYFTASEQEEERKQEMDCLVKIVDNMRSIRRELKLMEVLVSQCRRRPGEAVITVQGTDFPDQIIHEKDVPVGSIIIDKQLQLQDSSKKLLMSSEELRNDIIPHQKKYRALDLFSHKLEVCPGKNVLTGKGIHTLGKTQTLTSELAIVADYCSTANDGEGAIQMKLSREFYFTMNGATMYGHDIGMKYPSLLTRIALDSAFSKMAWERVKTSADYETNEASHKFTVKVGETELNFARTDRDTGTADVIPMYIPMIASAMVYPNSAPYCKLKNCLEGIHHLRKATDIIDYFIKFDFLEVSYSRSRMSALIQINPMYSKHINQQTVYQSPIVVHVMNDKVYGSVVNKLCMAMRVIDDVHRWCRDQFWSMFVDMICAASARFGFSATQQGQNVEVTAEARKLVFLMNGDDTSGVIIKVTEKDQLPLSLRWEALPVVGHFARFSYLCFASFTF